MKTSDPSFRILSLRIPSLRIPSPRLVAGVLGLSLASFACIITDDDDGSAVDDSVGTGNPPPGTGQPSTDGPSLDTGDTGVGTDTGNDVCEAAENAVADPGFEGGTPNADWMEASMVFETPICDASCTDEEGAAPYAGDWWVWFGGLDDEPEVASVEQAITVPEGAQAQLSFFFQIRSAAGTGDDMFTVELVDADVVDTVFMVTDLDMAAYGGSYHRVDLDITDWADGGTYTLRFAASIAGTGLTSFFLDEVSVVSCTEEGTGTDTGTDTAALDSTGTADTGTGSTGDTGTGSTGDTGTGSTGGSGSSSSTGAA